MLFDGTKLLGGDSFNEAKKHAGLNDDQMAERFVIICTLVLFLCRI